MQLVGNYLMAYGEYEAFTREEAARMEAFMNDNKASIGGFFGRMAKSDIAGTFKDVFGSDIFGKENADCGHISAVQAARKIEPSENSWLHDKIHSDQNLDPLESALLDFIADELQHSGL